MELSQRTGQLFYVLLGEGHPVGDHPNVIPIMCQGRRGIGHRERQTMRGWGETETRRKMTDNRRQRTRDRKQLCTRHRGKVVDVRCGIKKFGKVDLSFGPPPFGRVPSSSWGLRFLKSAIRIPQSEILSFTYTIDKTEFLSEM